MSVPKDVRWEVHRIATSSYYHASLIEVQRDWSMDDILDAHEVLDCYKRLQWVKERRMRNER